MVVPGGDSTSGAAEEKTDANLATENNDEPVDDEGLTGAGEGGDQE